MELKDLYPFVLLFLMTGLLIGIGVITLDAFGDQVKRESGTVVNESIAYNTYGTAKTTYDEPVTISYFGNSTRNCKTVAGCIGIVSITDAGYIQANSSFINSTYQLSYTYMQDTATTDTMDAVVSALTPISTVWMGLIITVAVLAIILGLVIGSFGGQRK